MLAALPPAAVAIYGAHVKNVIVALLGLAVTLAVMVGVTYGDLRAFQEERAARYAEQKADVAAVYEAVEAKYDVDVEPHGYPGNTYETWTIDGVEQTCRLAGNDLEENAEDPVLTCVVDESEIPSSEVAR